MNKPYESIPIQGAHQGDTSGHTSGSTSVRAPMLPAATQKKPPQEPKRKPAEGRTYQLMKSTEGRSYRVLAWTPGQEATAPEGYEPAGRYDTGPALTEALGDWPGATRFVVLENTETGATHVERADHLSDWMADERFDQFTIFESEDEAARYASGD